MSVGLAVVAAAGLLAWAISRAWPFTADDAFITFRYARNLANGAGPTFNAGQPPIGGYTSFLWMVVMSVPHLAGLDAVLFAKVAGILCTIACVALAAAWSREIVLREDGPPAGAIAFAVLSLAAFGSVAVHAVSGMDTALAMLLFTACLYAAYRMGVQPSMPVLIVTGTLALAASLARPDLVAPVAVALAGVAITQKAYASRTVAVSVLVFAVPIALFAAWRFSYYGQLLPLSYYVKVQNHSFEGLRPTLGFIRFVAVRCGALMLVAVWPVRRALVPAMAAAATMVALLMYPAHVMSYEARYLFPVLPFIIVLASAGAGLAPRVLSRAGMPGGTARVIPAALCGAVIVSLLWQTPGKLRNAREYGGGLRTAHETLGRQLGGLPVHGVLAIADAGAVPYYSDWQTIDTVGLNDVAIAITHRHDAAEVLDRHADVLVLMSSDAERFDPLAPWEGDLHALAVARGFHRATTRRFGAGYYLWVLVNGGTPAGVSAGAALERQPI